jgi:hypothetical protein
MVTMEWVPNEWCDVLDAETRKYLIPVYAWSNPYIDICIVHTYVKTLWIVVTLHGTNGNHDQVSRYIYTVEHVTRNSVRNSQPISGTVLPSTTRTHKSSPPESCVYHHI